MGTLRRSEVYFWFLFFIQHTLSDIRAVSANAGMTTIHLVPWLPHLSLSNCSDCGIIRSSVSDGYDLLRENKLNLICQLQSILDRLIQNPLILHFRVVCEGERAGSVRDKRLPRCGSVSNRRHRNWRSEAMYIPIFTDSLRKKWPN